MLSGCDRFAFAWMQSMHIQYTVITKAYKYAITHSRDQPEKLWFLDFLYTHTNMQTKPISRNQIRAWFKKCKTIRSSNYQSKFNTKLRQRSLKFEVDNIVAAWVPQNSFYLIIYRLFPQLWLALSLGPFLYWIVKRWPSDKANHSCENGL